MLVLCLEQIFQNIGKVSYLFMEAYSWQFLEGFYIPYFLGGEMPFPYMKRCGYVSC